MEVTNINQLDIANGFYTYADYLLWKFEERLELIKGKIFRMSPAPAIAHQRVSRKLSGELYHFFKGKTCELFTAPFDVVLPNAYGKEDSVVQPDLCVVCTPEKLADGKRCVGAPDLVVEILSPHNSMRDLDLKFHLYEEAGVLEYWIVRPESKEINVYVLQESKYYGLPPIVEGKDITSIKFPTLKLNTKDIF